MSFSNKNVKDLCDKFELNHLIKDPACIDNLYTNKKNMFFNSFAVEITISIYHSHNALLDIL